MNHVLKTCTNVNTAVKELNALRKHMDKPDDDLEILVDGMWLDTTDGDYFHFDHNRHKVRLSGRPDVFRLDTTGWESTEIRATASSHIYICLICY